MQFVERNGIRAPAIGLGTYPMVGENCYRAVFGRWKPDTGISTPRSFMETKPMSAMRLRTAACPAAKFS